MQDYSQRYRQNSSNYDEPLTNGRSSYNFQNMQKSIQLSQTDKRIQQIKRKYDTPSRRQRLSKMSGKKSDYGTNKQNDNYGTADFKTRNIIITNTHTQTSEPGMQQSKVISNSRQTFANIQQSSVTKSMLCDKSANQKYDNRTMNKLYKNENEEEFFKRVKEMKQSLLCGDGSSKISERKGLGASNDTKGLYETNKTVEKDRIDNIDKINQKIRGILDCLNENQKTRFPPNVETKKVTRPQAVSMIGDRARNYDRDITRTPVKNVVSSSLMGRQSFGNHRHQRSELLDKIEINRADFKNQMKQEKPQDDDKWEKLSSKLERYEFQNKIRLQKAFDFSKQIQKQAPDNKNIVETIRRSRCQLDNDIKKSVELVRRDNRSVDFRDMKSRSFLNSNIQSDFKETRDRSLHTRDLTGVKQYQMKSGKKLDDQIDRIQKKIEQFEEQKKRLNINFKPFEYSNTKSSSNLAINRANLYPQKTISDFAKNEAEIRQKYQNLKNKQTTLTYEQKGENQDTFRQKKMSFGDCFADKTYPRLQSKIQIKLQKSNPSSVKTSKFISNDSSRVSSVEGREQISPLQIENSQVSGQSQARNQLKEKSYFFHFDESLKRNTDQGIEQRKKRLMNFETDRPNNAELKELVKALCDQVQLDEEFRNAKIWFEYNMDPIKEESVKKLLPDINPNEVREILKVRESENNPFFTAQGFQSSYEKLVELYKKSEGHWNETISKKFDRKALQSQGFTCKQMDLEKKGHISLGDLVRFLNLESGTFYRNRDLSLVFIRICKQKPNTTFTEANFEWLLDAFCQ